MFIQLYIQSFRTGSHTPADRFGLFFRCGSIHIIVPVWVRSTTGKLVLSRIVIVYDSVLYLKGSVLYLLVVPFWSVLCLKRSVRYCSLFPFVPFFVPIDCSVLFVVLFCSFFWFSSLSFVSSFLRLEPTSCLFAVYLLLLPPLFFLLSWVSNLLPVYSLPITNSFLRSSFFFLAVRYFLLFIFSSSFSFQVRFRSTCCNGVGGVARVSVLRVGCCPKALPSCHCSILLRLSLFTIVMSLLCWNNRQTMKNKQK